MFNSKFNKQFSTKLQELNDLIHQYDQSNTTNVNVIMELINNLAEQVCSYTNIDTTTNRFKRVDG